MREMNLQYKTVKKFVATTDSRHNEPVAPNLLNRDFKVKTPNTVWVSDITYLRIDRRWHYLTVIIEAVFGCRCSRIGDRIISETRRDGQSTWQRIIYIKIRKA